MRVTISLQVLLLIHLSRNFSLFRKSPRVFSRITASTLPQSTPLYGSHSALLSPRNPHLDAPPPQPPSQHQNSAVRMTATAMEEASPPPAGFRVLFSDGDREIHAGGVVIEPAITFQRLQSLVGDLIGIPPHQIKLYLLRQKKVRSGRSPPEIRRKTPIGEGTDFTAVAREKGCVILAQLKGAKKDRRGKGRRDRVGVGVGVGGEGNFAPEKKRVLLPEKAVLRRPVEVHVGAPAAPPSAPLAREAELSGMFHYENLRDLQRQRERYLFATAAAAYCGYTGGGARHGYGAAGFGVGCALADAAASVCEVCSGAGGGRAAPFHWCVHDRVVAEGFRSSAGPIQRPLKSRVQVSA